MVTCGLKYRALCFKVKGLGFAYGLGRKAAPLEIGQFCESPSDTAHPIRRS